MWSLRILATTFLAILLITMTAFSQTSAFNFQGRLNDGSNPANGRYDLQFKLFDSITGGTEVAPVNDRPNLLLINGVFSTTLDFGALAYTSGQRFIEISVRPLNSPNPHVVLGARQQILAVPIAIRATSATNADNATNATNATNAQNAVNAASATTAAHAADAKALGGIVASGYARLNVQNTGNVIAENLGSSGLLQVQGNTIQGQASFGLPKAMLHMNTLPNPMQVIRCYNGTTGVSTGNCGFTVIEALGHGVGVYHINFGFPVNDRFVALAVDNAGAPLFNTGINYRFNSGNLEVFTFVTNNSNNDTVGRNFMVIVY